MDRQIESIAVIGLGLIGASFAGAYRKAYPGAPILGVDVSQEAIDELRDAAGSRKVLTRTPLNFLKRSIRATWWSSQRRSDRCQSISACSPIAIIRASSPIPVPRKRRSLKKPKLSCLISITSFLGILWLARRRVASRVRATTSSRTLTGSCVPMSILRPMSSRRSMRCSRRSVRAW